MPDMIGLGNIRIVLVGSLYSGNVGAVCRAMANMGLSQLCLVTPQIVDGWSDGRKMAVHAGDILANRSEVDSIQAATGDSLAVVGTTARAGLYRQHVRTPRELAPELLALASKGTVSLVFGREDHGLSNEEVSHCTHLLRIPTADEYISINLAQAVMLCCYELFQSAGEFEIPDEKSAPTTARQRERLQELWREAMMLIGFMQDQKADHMMQGFQRIFSRGIKTDDDISIMMGVARQTIWAARNKQAKDFDAEQEEL